MAKCPPEWTDIPAWIPAGHRPSPCTAAWKLAMSLGDKMSSVVLRKVAHLEQISELRSRLMHRGLYLSGGRNPTGPRLTVKLAKGVPFLRHPPPVPGLAPPMPAR